MDGDIGPIVKRSIDFIEGGIVDVRVPKNGGEKTQQNPDWLGDLEEKYASHDWVGKEPMREITQGEEMDRAIREIRE